VAIGLPFQRFSAEVAGVEDVVDAEDVAAAEDVASAVEMAVELESVEVADADLGVGTDDDDDNEVEPIAFGAMNMEDILEGVAVLGELNTEPQMSVEDICAGLAGAEGLPALEAESADKAGENTDAKNEWKQFPNRSCSYMALIRMQKKVKIGPKKDVGMTNMKTTWDKRYAIRHGEKLDISLAAATSSTKKPWKLHPNAWDEGSIVMAGD
jgi:hypothetical protein